MTSSSERRDCLGGRLAELYHPVDLPEGYHVVPAGEPGKLCRWLKGLLPPGHRMVGLCQADGMSHDFLCAKSSVILRQQQGITPPARRRMGRMLGRDWL
jgi:hypothetical protein